MEIKSPNKETICMVCGETIEYLGKKPKCCRTFDCRSKFENKTDIQNWKAPRGQYLVLQKDLLRRANEY